MYPGANRDFITVGMPDTAVRESRERIKSALINSGFGYPNKSVTINLAPANVRKEGAGFDLPMALGILGAMGAVEPTDEHLFVGELSLDGAIRPVRGALSIAACARREGIPNLLVPAENANRGRGGRGSARLRHAASCRSGGVIWKSRRISRPIRCSNGRGRPWRRAHSRFSRRARADDGEARARSGRGGRPQRAVSRDRRVRAKRCSPSDWLAFCRR